MIARELAGAYRQRQRRERWQRAISCTARRVIVIELATLAYLMVTR